MLSNIQLAYFLGPLLISLIGFYTVNYLKHRTYKNTILQAKSQADQRLQEASTFAEEQKQILTDLESEFESAQKSSEERIVVKKASAQKRESRLEQYSQRLETLAKELTSLQNDQQVVTDKYLTQLSKVSGLNAFDAKDQVKNRLEQEFNTYLEKQNAVYLNTVKNQCSKHGVNILKQTMQRFTGSSSVDKGTKLVKFSSKRAFDHLCGQDDANLQYIAEKLSVEIDHCNEANTLRVSAFVIWHQETAKLVLKKLIACSKITTEVIDQKIDLATREFEQHLIRLGHKIADIIELENRHPEVLQIMGRLKYRTSYGQNVLKHSFEVAYMAQSIASQIGANPREAFLGGFFHDLGKAIDQIQDGSHDLLGAEFLRKHDFPFAVFHPAESHHYAIPPETVEAEIVIIADKLSASRQGARTESAEMYLQRVQGLETIASETQGIKKAYALAAGREIRSFVDEKNISDTDMLAIAEKMADQISEEIIFPGKIKVNLIRTVESVDFANKK